MLTASAGFSVLLFLTRTLLKPFESGKAEPQKLQILCETLVILSLVAEYGFRSYRIYCQVG